MNPARITADVVDAQSFPSLSTRFRVRGVPMTLIDGRRAVTGAAPEPQVMAEVRAALASL